ncbi:UNVERIFIED_CONTAM: hypothetical protein GTU68_031091 [Idotea baltica]|nr:hypothetical protein [Idotea baltica]
MAKVILYTFPPKNLFLMLHWIRVLTCRFPVKADFVPLVAENCLKEKWI